MSKKEDKQHVHEYPGPGYYDLEQGTRVRYTKVCRCGHRIVEDLVNG